MYDSQFKLVALSIFASLKMYKLIKSQLSIQDLQIYVKRETGWKIFKYKNVIKNVTNEKHSLQQKFPSMFNLGTTSLTTRPGLIFQSHSEALGNHCLQTRIKNNVINLIQDLGPDVKALSTSFSHVIFPNFKENILTYFYGWGSTVSRLQIHYQKSVYFLTLNPQKFLVLRKAERLRSILEPPIGFESGIH